MLEQEIEKSEIETVIDILTSIHIDDNLAAARQSLDDLGVDIADDMHIQPITIEGGVCQLITPPQADKEKIVLYLHGGGYFCGSLQSHGGMVSELARAANICALQLSYRKAPEHKFPAPIEDSVAAYQWLLAQGYQAENIIIAGDSAGGGLTMATLIYLRDNSIPLPACAICISPWVDMAATGESHINRKAIDPIVTMDTVDMVIKLYMDGEDISSPLASPICGDLTGLPPLLVQVGEREILYSDAEMLVNKAKADGVEAYLEEWKEMVHVWHMFYPQLTEARTALAKIGSFINQHTGKSC